MYIESYSLLRVVIVFLLSLIGYNAISQNGLDLEKSEFVIIGKDSTLFSSKKEIDNADFIKVLLLIDSATIQHNISPINGEINGKYYIQIKWLKSSSGKIVIINGLCTLFKEEREIWKKEIIKINDGGSCYFSLKIDLVNMKYFDFRTN